LSRPKSEEQPYPTQRWAKQWSMVLKQSLIEVAKYELMAGHAILVHEKMWQKGKTPFKTH
jgi:hypothetical protein